MSRVLAVFAPAELVLALLVFLGAALVTYSPADAVGSLVPPLDARAEGIGIAIEIDRGGSGLAHQLTEALDRIDLTAGTRLR
mgnify:CR=1 FL=1